jgi:N-acetylglucosaminyl-diphospho-decaprenol L-rhamnosyltransferase
MASSQPALAVVLVNYCTASLTIDCLRSLEPELKAFPGSYALVSDNASPDGSGAAIETAIAANGWSDWARVLHLPRNGGFGYGNNAAIRTALERDPAPRFVWLLNTDTVLRPGAIAPLLDCLDAKPEAGFAGSRLEHPDGTRQASAFCFHSICGEFDDAIQVGLVSRLLAGWKVAPSLPDHTARFDWLSGASLMVRASVFDSVGYFDENYFLYYEETDFCRRAAQAGWSCWYVPQSRIVHLVGRSTGVTNVKDAVKKRPPYWFESRRRYFISHHGLVYATLADLALAAGTALSSLRNLLLRRPSSHPEQFLSDLARHSALLNPSLTSTGAGQASK